MVGAVAVKTGSPRVVAGAAFRFPALSAVTDRSLLAVAMVRRVSCRVRGGGLVFHYQRVTETALR